MARLIIIMMGLKFKKKRRTGSKTATKKKNMAINDLKSLAKFMYFKD